MKRYKSKQKQSRKFCVPFPKIIGKSPMPKNWKFKPIRENLPWYHKDKLAKELRPDIDL